MQPALQPLDHEERPQAEGEHSQPSHQAQGAVDGQNQAEPGQAGQDEAPAQLPKPLIDLPEQPFLFGLLYQMGQLPGRADEFLFVRGPLRRVRGPVLQGVNGEALGLELVGQFPRLGEAALDAFQEVLQAGLPPFHLGPVRLDPGFLPVQPDLEGGVGGPGEALVQPERLRVQPGELFVEGGDPGPGDGQQGVCGLGQRPLRLRDFRPELVDPDFKTRGLDRIVGGLPETALGFLQLAVQLIQLTADLFPLLHNGGILHPVLGFLHLLQLFLQVGLFPIDPFPPFLDVRLGPVNPVLQPLFLVQKILSLPLQPSARRIFQLGIGQLLVEPGDPPVQGGALQVGQLFVQPGFLFFESRQLSIQGFGLLPQAHPQKRQLPINARFPSLPAQNVFCIPVRRELEALFQIIFPNFILIGVRPVLDIVISHLFGKPLDERDIGVGEKSLPVIPCAVEEPVDGGGDVRKHVAGPALHPAIQGGINVGGIEEGVDDGSLRGSGRYLHQPFDRPRRRRIIGVHGDSVSVALILLFLFSSRFAAGRNGVKVGVIMLLQIRDEEGGGFLHAIDGKPIAV